ncbi:hypothetical protein V8F06_014881 [Rhypophila decipiens]
MSPIPRVRVTKTKEDRNANPRESFFPLLHQLFENNNYRGLTMSQWDQHAPHQQANNAAHHDDRIHNVVGGSNYPMTERQWSNLPEVVHPPDYPEVVQYRDDSHNYPEVGSPESAQAKVEPGGEGTPGVATAPHYEEQQQPKWWRRRRSVLLTAAVAVLVLVAVAVGVAVPLSRRGGNGDASTPTPGVTAGAFGTPISFPAEAAVSACQGTVCPQILATAGFATPATTFVFARGTDNGIWYREIREDGSVWATAEWQSLGGSFLSQPAATSMRDGRVDVFAVWNDHTTRFKTFQNGVWESEWTSLAGICTSPPVACARDIDNTEVVLVGSDRQVYHKYAKNGNTWGPSLSGDWQLLEGVVSSSVDIGCTTGTRAYQRIDLVAYTVKGGNEGMLSVNTWNDNDGWSKWVGGGGPILYKGDPTVVVTADRTDYFGVGSESGAIYTTLLNRTSWTTDSNQTAVPPFSSMSLDGAFQSVVTAVTTDDTPWLDILAVGTDNRLKHKARSHDGTWSPKWDDLGGHLNSAPKAVVLNATAVAVFAIGPNGTIIHSVFAIRTGLASWEPGQWYSDGGSMTLKWHYA